jgi:hypothetical protein
VTQFSGWITRVGKIKRRNRHRREQMRENELRAVAAGPREGRRASVSI